MGSDALRGTAGDVGRQGLEPGGLRRPRLFGDPTKPHFELAYAPETATRDRRRNRICAVSRRSLTRPFPGLTGETGPDVVFRVTFSTGDINVAAFGPHFTRLLGDQVERIEGRSVWGIA